jgi:excisionase family DNA binding protein
MTHQRIEFRHLRFSVPEAAEHLRVSRALIYKLISAGKLTPLKLGNRTIISGAEIQRLTKSEEA